MYFFYSEIDLNLDNLQNRFLHAVSVGEGKCCTISWLKRSYQECFGINTKLPEFEEKLKLFLHEKEVSFHVTKKRRRGEVENFFHGLGFSRKKPYTPC